MGCDIHLVLEQYDTDLGWVGVDTFESHEGGHGKGWCRPIVRERNYKLFAAIAGVRGEGPPPRGIPDDASATTRFLVKQWGEDGHSHSWLPLDDAAREWNAERYPGEKRLDPNDYRARFPKSFWFGVDEDDATVFRVVFWFDN